MKQTDAAVIKNLLDKTGDFQIIADVFKTMGDATRVRVFWLLCHYEACVSRIAAMMDMSSPAVAHHLKELKDAGLIEGLREGREVYYSASDTSQSRLLHQMIEQVMEIACPELDNLPGDLDHAHQCPEHSSSRLTGYESEQLEIIRKVHEVLASDLEHRWTVEELARKFLMNPTTLKALFKEVYGTSIAAHVRQHRMKQAELYLRRSSLSIAEIALKVGYGSQSKFTKAFKDYYGELPKDYRKSH